MSKRLLAVLLALAMLLSLVPVGALAQETDGAAAQSMDEECYLDADAEYEEDEEGNSRTTVHTYFSTGSTHSDAMVVAAAYEGQKMIASTYTQVGSGDASADLVLDGLPEITFLRVFLLDEKTLEPLCGSCSIYTGPSVSVYDEGKQGDVAWTFDGGWLYVSSETGEPVELAPQEGGLREYGWSKYADQITTVQLENISRIPRGAFSEYRWLNQVNLCHAHVDIGDMAFYGCAQLESVETISAAIASVGQQAFDGCKWLASVDGLDNCKKIDDYAFQNCTNLTGSLWLKNLQELGYGAFAGSGLESVSFEGSVFTEIPAYAFTDCKRLYDVTLPKSVTRIDEGAFAWSGLQGISLYYVEEICPWAFTGTKLDYVYLGNLKSLGTYAFAGAQLADIRLDGTITEIPEGAFQAAWIDYIDLGESVKTIRAEAFAKSKVEALGVSDQLEYIEANAFRDAVLGYLAGTCENVSFDAIGNEAFRDAYNNLYLDADQAEYLDAPKVTVKTQETAPEEIVPEETVETAPEEPQPSEETEEAAETPTELTAEEAAEGGYYLAPDGAEMTEELQPEEMAAYTGTEKVKKDTHTVTFTGLLPYSDYALIVSTVPGSLEGRCLQYIAQGWSNSSGSLTFDYIPRTDAKAVVQLYGPDKLTLEPSKNYLMLHPGEAAKLEFNCSDPEAEIYPQNMEWNDSEDAWTFWDQDGMIALYARQTEERSNWQVEADPGYLYETTTYYVTFCAIGGGQNVTTKIRVDVVPDGRTVESVQLGETAVTRNVFDLEPTELPIFLQLDSGDSWEEYALNSAEGDDTTYMESVSFSPNTPADVQKFFTVELKDERTLLLRSNADIIGSAADVKSLKSSYKGISFDVKIKGQGETLTTQAMTLTVKKDLPKIKAAPVILNPYYAAQAQVRYTGGEVWHITEDIDCGNAAIAFASRDDFGADTFYVDYTKPMKAASLNIKTKVRVEGCLIPLDVTIPVKLEVKAPALKLDTNKWTISSVGAEVMETGYTCTTKGVAMDQLYIDWDAQVVDKKGNPVEGYAAGADGEKIYLSTTGDLRPLGRQDLRIRFRVCPYDSFATPDTQGVWLEVPVAVTSQDPKVSLQRTNFTLNMDIDQSLDMYVVVSGMGSLEEPQWKYRISGGGMKDASAYFDVSQNGSYDDGDYLLSVTPKFDEAAMGAAYEKAVNSTYTMYLGLGNKASTKLTLKLTTKQPSVKLTTSGTLDPNNINSRVPVKAEISNANWLVELNHWITPADAPEEETDTMGLWFEDGPTGTSVRAETGKQPISGKYILNMVYGYYDVYGKEVPVTTASAPFQVKSAKPALKVTGKLESLNADSFVTLIPGYVRTDENNVIPYPQVSITDPKGRTLEENVDYTLLDYEERDTTGLEGNLYIYPVTDGDSVLAPGKYTVILTYDAETFGEALRLTGSFQVTQTPAKVTLEKNAVTIHPQVMMEPVHLQVIAEESSAETDWQLELCDKKGNPVEDTGLIRYSVEQHSEKRKDDDENVIYGSDGAIDVVGTGKIPAADTTLYLKLTPDSRIPGKYQMLTVKVLGQASIRKLQKLNLATKATLDPSYGTNFVSLTGTLKGWDAGDMVVKAELQVSTDYGRTYGTVAGDTYVFQRFDRNTKQLRVNVSTQQAIDPNAKYRVTVKAYGERTCETLIGTAIVNLKVAYGANKFTVDKGLTLYRADAAAGLELPLSAKDADQRIRRIVVKGRNDFAVYRSSGSWILHYTGSTPEKLKTATLTLQIFLKGNTTDKPNATTAVKLTVK